MIPLPLAEVEPLGRLARAGWTDEATGVQIDSRRVEEGDLFVVVGSGGDFVKHALARGAAAVLHPDDAFAALAAIGAAIRARSDARVVGITGSTGKTSTKDILAALCKPHAKTVAAEGGHNNEIGLPLTLARIEPDTEVVVAEMGMRGVGQIAELCEIARPDVAIVTGVGPVHLELLGTVERVAQAKSEIVGALPPGGVAVAPIPAAELEPFLARDDVEVRRFGPGGDASVVGFEAGDDHADVAFDLRGRRIELRFNFTSRHQADNAAAALLAYDALGLPLDRVQEGAGGDRVFALAWGGNAASRRRSRHQRRLQRQPRLHGGRSERTSTPARAAAGASPSSETWPSWAPTRRLTTGGSDSAVAEHADVLVAVGELARGYLDAGVAEQRHASTVEEAIAAVEELLRPGDVVLVKASRSAGLERVAEALTAAKV